MTNDKVPEERKPEYAELIKMLHQAYGKPLRVPPERQEQALARARERLGFTEPENPPATFESSPIDFAGARINEEPEPHQRGFLRLISLIAAVLVVGALIVSSLLVFQARHPTTVTTTPTTVATSETTTPTTVATSEIKTHDLDVVLQVSPGPYFLGEMIEVKLTFTNYSSTASYYVKSGYDAKNCAPDLRNNLAVVMTGSPLLADTMLQHKLAGFDCSAVAQDYGVFGPVFGTSNNLSVETTTVLTYSGLVTLATPLGFINFYTRKYVQSPLGGRTPSIQINVQTKVPPGRLITGQQRGTQVTISAPPSVRNQLLYTYKTTCPGNPSWQWASIQRPPLTLQKPACINNPGAKVTEWAYAVGAPGYSVVAGSVKG